MFEYFPTNYAWNLAVVMAINAGGVMSEIDTVCRPLLPREKEGAKANAAWSASWATLANRVAGYAQIEEAAGHRRSAARRYQRASLYSFMSERNADAGAERLETYKQALAYFRKSTELAGENIEFVEVPFRGASMPALFVKAKGVSSPAPCMVHFDGLDVTKELLHMRGVASQLAERGISVLLVDHPGVGEALRLRNMTSEPETEQPAKACVDYLETRSDVDRGRIGMIALSLGGYYAPRAAAFEKRFACCVAWGALFDYGEITQQRVRGARSALSVSDWAAHVKWVFGQETVEGVLAVTRRMTLEGVVDKITCPLLVVHGEKDRQIPVEHAHRTYDGAVNSPNRKLKIFTEDEGGCEHCQIDNATVGVDYMADWIVDVLGASRPGLARSLEGVSQE